MRLDLRLLPRSIRRTEDRDLGGGISVGDSPTAGQIVETYRSAALQATVFLPQQKDPAAGQTAAESASR
jgi:hypothetical protein